MSCSQGFAVLGCSAFAGLTLRFELILQRTNLTPHSTVAVQFNLRINLAFLLNSYLPPCKSHFPLSLSA